RQRIRPLLPYTTLFRSQAGESVERDRLAAAGRAHGPLEQAAARDVEQRERGRTCRGGEAGEQRAATERVRRGRRQGQRSGRWRWPHTEARAWHAAHAQLAVVQPHHERRGAALEQPVDRHLRRRAALEQL